MVHCTVPTAGSSASCFRASSTTSHSQQSCRPQQGQRGHTTRHNCCCAAASTAAAAAAAAGATNSTARRSAILRLGMLSRTAEEGQQQQEEPVPASMAAASMHVFAISSHNVLYNSITLSSAVKRRGPTHVPAWHGSRSTTLPVIRDGDGISCVHLLVVMYTVCCITLLLSCRTITSHARCQVQLASLGSAGVCTQHKSCSSKMSQSLSGQGH
jgi:hypothetical protein